VIIFLWAMVGYFGVQFVASLMVVIHKPEAATWVRATRVFCLVVEIVLLLWAISILLAAP